MQYYIRGQNNSNNRNGINNAYNIHIYEAVFYSCSNLSEFGSVNYLYF